MKLLKCYVQYVKPVKMLLARALRYHVTRINPRWMGVEPKGATFPPLQSIQERKRQFSARERRLLTSSLIILLPQTFFWTLFFRVLAQFFHSSQIRWFRLSGRHTYLDFSLLSFGNCLRRFISPGEISLSHFYRHYFRPFLFFSQVRGANGI